MIKLYKKEIYQVYAKGGPYAPKKEFNSFNEACDAAKVMSERYPGKEFYVLRRFAGPYLVEKEAKKR